jgi:hypothetical protein
MKEARMQDPAAALSELEHVTAAMLLAASLQAEEVIALAARRAELVTAVADQARAGVFGLARLQAVAAAGEWLVARAMAERTDIRVELDCAGKEANLAHGLDGVISEQTGGVDIEA